MLGHQVQPQHVQCMPIPDACATRSTIHSKDIPLFDVLKLVVESALY